MMIKKLLKIILTYTLKPYIKFIYLASPRQYSYDNLSLQVDVDVFHPGLFYSSRLFADFINDLPLKNKTLLDLGSGSGILSLVGAKKGAKVTAVDISEVAVVNTRKNAHENKLNITSLQSDLFSQVTQRYDYIVVNPPYYPKTPKSSAEQAWYCGASHEYFERFFGELSNYCEVNGKVYMIMSEECDLIRIKKIARLHDFSLNIVLKRKFLLEDNFIFEISKCSVD
ncbi:methyltransferase [Aliikangiella coralliicola]|uniref:Methyltransferase n=1 Tax=Aliikangiella coralliicola TaxID=2592383 RepID=A0A545UJ61_9GAMM|nr:methyltransferase [Aliikangiella coralliicola]TQV89501.1 methyltransferase [Aliikangiella coralliicola]